MYISNEDFKFLLELEQFLWNFGSTKEYLKLYNINEKLLKNKEKNNIKNWNRIKEKRKIDKNYAR